MVIGWQLQYIRLVVDRLKHGSVSMELTKHCNLKCARCDHTSPWFDESFASFDQFVHDFDRLTAVMDIDESTGRARTIERLNLSHAQ